MDKLIPAAMSLARLTGRPSYPITSNLHAPRNKIKGRFLKGPIPLSWLQQAAQLPGQALHVSIALHYLAGLTGQSTVSLGNKLLLQFGVLRGAKARALTALTNAGLVRVSQSSGCNPQVSIVWLDAAPDLLG